MRILEVQPSSVVPSQQTNYTSRSLNDMETLIQSVQPQVVIPMATQQPNMPMSVQPNVLMETNMTTQHDIPVSSSVV